MTKIIKRIAVLTSGGDAPGMNANITNCKPSINFIDMQLPKRNGIECLRLIKSHPLCKDIPVVLCSTSFIPGDVRSAYREGAHYFFERPSSFRDLVAELEIVNNIKNPKKNLGTENSFP